MCLSLGHERHEAWSDYRGVLHMMDEDVWGCENGRMDALGPEEADLHWSNVEEAAVRRRKMDKVHCACEVVEIPCFDTATVDGIRLELATCVHSDAANAAHLVLIAASEVVHCGMTKNQNCVEESGCHSYD